MLLTAERSSSPCELKSVSYFLTFFETLHFRLRNKEVLLGQSIASTEENAASSNEIFSISLIHETNSLGIS